MRHPRVYFLLGGLCGIWIGALASCAGQSLAHQHGEHADFFRSLKRPDFPWMSCCNEQDCDFTDDWRTTKDGFEVRIAGEWVAVPPERVLNRASPSGRAVVCINSTGILCFLAGVMT